MAIEDPSRPVEGALRVWLKVFNDSDLSLIRGYVAIPLYSLKNSPVEVLTITLYKHYPCRGYPYRKEALITDLMFSWNSHTPDLWGVLYKDDLFGSTLFYPEGLILNCRYSL